MGSAPGEWGHQSDEKLHQVKLAAYQIATTPTTFYQFALFSEATDRGLASRTPYWGRFGDHPVVNVNWYEAAEYANWLNEQQGLAPVYRIQKVKDSDRNNRVRTDF
ncbi:MAG: SUMF1/EgtB/PvdO family nonheme iron enzyme [Saprospirales bacterium]|nr:SUMF1/EgtB/PvdO family nonheme iron enzyme [Saprospirales bacterium]